MTTSSLHFRPEPSLTRRFRSAVSLHGHTLHSKERLTIVGRLIHAVPLLHELIQRERRRMAGPDATPIDFSQVWWTPPLSARQALGLETKQIENKLGLAALVSLSDHDNIDGPVRLRMMRETRTTPISVEWTVPFGETCFHLGIHNLPATGAAEAMQEMAAYTQAPRPNRLPALLAEISRTPETLVIFNHPMWDQTGVGPSRHAALLRHFVGRCKPYLHAAEINGLRSWVENSHAVAFAEAAGFPLISGADRHGREPSAVLNLTNAACFAEFADDVRRKRESTVLLMPHYQQPLKLRILQNMADVLRDDPDHSLGWVRWSDRVFHCSPEGTISSLGESWVREPAMIRHFLRAVKILSNHRLQPALRLALAGRRTRIQEAAS